VIDRAAKSALLMAWLAKHSHRSVRVAAAGQPLDARVIIGRIDAAVRHTASAEWIYLLTADEDAPVPVYVGKTKSPAHRWKGHLAGLASGRGVYTRWRDALLDQRGAARCALSIWLIPASAISDPPIPGFPSTVGAVEYQLVSLAGDAYGRLLNSEGNRR
jgi:hypothetical protein